MSQLEKMLQFCLISTKNSFQKLCGSSSVEFIMIQNVTGSDLEFSFSGLEVSLAHFLLLYLHHLCSFRSTFLFYPSTDKYFHSKVNEGQTSQLIYALYTAIYFPIIIFPICLIFLVNHSSNCDGASTSLMQFRFLPPSLRNGVSAG